MKSFYKATFLALALSSSVAMANPVGVPIDFFCPFTQGSPNVITNFGDYIAGYGEETLLDQTNRVYFRSTTALPANTPEDLLNYSSESATYSSTTGKVSCHYVSSDPNEPNITVSYVATNARGGALQGQSANSVSILLPISDSK